MSNNPTDLRKKPVDLLEPTDYGQYLLHSRSEMLQVLRQLLVGNNQITVFFNDGADFILTTLLAVTNEGLVFDSGANTEINKRAFSAAKLFCTSSLDKIRVQFVLHGLKSITHDGRPAFSAVLPDSLLRLQRREYFRLVMPVTRRLICQIPLGDDDHLDVDMIDLSGGGLAMVVAPDRMRFEPDMEFANCRIELPEIGFITVTIKVLTTFEVTLRNGAHVKRAGCKFVNLPGNTTNLIQRYIIKIERERKAHESGML
jgi:c-di-GMP-binding flagellar brake protein YcgR